MVCTGYITSTPISFDGKTVKVQIQGKSRTVDLVDCCPKVSGSASGDAGKTWIGLKTKDGTVSATTPTNTWSSLTGYEVISALAAPYGISVKDEIGLNEKLANFTVTPGDTVVQSINQIVTKQNLVVTDDEYGNLVIANVGSAGSCDDALVVGKNVLKGEAKFDFSKCYSDYIVYGQHKGTDTASGKDAAEDKGTASDPSVTRYRLKVIKDEGQSSNEITKSLASFTARYNRAQSLKATYTVHGWRQSSGKLWTVNTKVVVSDPVADPGVDFVITKIAFELSAKGMTSVIEVCEPSGFKREEKASEKDKNTKGATWQNVA